MATMPAQQAGVCPAPSASQGSAPGATLDMDYYLNEGLEGVERQKYRGTREFTYAIESKLTELGLGDWKGGQYLVFTSVTQGEFTELDRYRDRYHKSLRFMYLEEKEVLIVKISLGLIKGVVCGELGRTLTDKADEMGLYRGGVVGSGAATFQGLGSKNEAGATFIPILSENPSRRWPTVVFGGGISESLERMRVDSRWWLESSLGWVKIVILISISKSERKIHIEQWEMPAVLNRRVTQAHPHPVREVTKIHEVDIIGGVATGAPLRLDFEKIYRRPPGPGEGDTVYTAQGLEEWAAIIWSDDVEDLLDFM